jgi:hypothetical protein
VSIDCQFVKDIAYVTGPSRKERDAGQGLVWPDTPTLPNMIYPGRFKMNPFLDFLSVVGGVDAYYTLEPTEVQQAAARLNAYLQSQGEHERDDDIRYGEHEGQVLPYYWLRDLTILFGFAAKQGLTAYAC